MNNGIVYISEPCAEDLSKMLPCGGGFHCSLCNKKVHDLSKFSTQQVNEFNKTTDDVCVIVHARHEITTAYKYNFINKTENVFLKHGLKKMALVFTTLLLFLTSCTLRKHRKVGTIASQKTIIHESEIPK